MGFDGVADDYDNLLRQAHGLPGNGTPRGDKVGFPTGKQGFSPHPNSEHDRFQPFPTQALPKIVRRFCCGVARALGCNDVFTVFPAIVCLAAAIGASRRIRVKSGFEEYPGVYACVVALSGSGKTPSARQVMRPYREIEDLLIERHESSSSIPVIDFDDDPQDPATESPTPRLIVSDATVEALTMRLKNAEHGLLLENDELAGFFGSFDRYRGGKGGDRSVYLKTYDGHPIVVDRKTGPENERTIRIPRGLLSVFGGIQPGVLGRLLSDDDHDSGLPARFIFCQPPDKPLAWSDEDLPDPAEFKSLLLHLVESRSQEKTYRLTHEARELMRQHVDQVAKDLARHKGAYRPFLSKSAGRVARIACILQAVDGDEDQVPEHIMANAITIGQWANSENLRIYRTVFSDREKFDPNQVIELLKESGGMSAYEIHRQYRSQFPSTDDAERFLCGIEQAGKVQRTVKQTGGQPKVIFTAVRGET